MGLGSRVASLKFGVWGLGSEIKSAVSGIRVQVKGLGFMVYGLGFRV